MAAHSSNVLMEEDQDMDVDKHKFDARDKQLDLLFKIYSLIDDKLPIGIKGLNKINDNSLILDVDVSNQIAGFFSTLFTYLRKKKNSSDSATKYEEYTTTISGHNFKVKDVAAEVLQLGTEIDFMIATPIMNVITCFKPMFDEVRTGVTRFSLKGDKKKKRSSQGTSDNSQKGSNAKHSISAYGLNNNHIPLLQGITLPPERRTGLLKSIGPLALALYY